MKYLQAAAVAVALLFTLTACTEQLPGSPGDPTPTPTASPTPTPSPTPQPIANPLTGVTGNYAEKRPVAVTLRTGEGTAPLWGISRADVLVQGVTEGYTAGMMALFSDPEGAAKIGPVGSGRDLMLQIALPLNAVPVHIGKNVYASNLLNALTYQDLDGLHIGKAAFAFDEERQQSGYREENCWYTTADLIRAGLETYGTSLTGSNTPLFRFGERPTVAEEARNGTELTLTFSSSDTVRLSYDAGQGTYRLLDADGGEILDGDTGSGVSFQNVVVLYASSGIKDDGYTRQYDMSGGDGLYLTDGAWQAIRWSKGDATAPLALTDTDGAPLTVNPGRSYIALWGGYYGQSVRLTAADGSEQILPEKPALLDSGVPDDVAASAEAEYQTYLAVMTAQAELDTLRAQLETSQIDLQEAQAAMEAALETADTEDDAAAEAALTEAQAIVDQLQAKIDERQAIIDAANSSQEESQGNAEGDGSGEGEDAGEETSDSGETTEPAAEPAE